MVTVAWNSHPVTQPTTTALKHAHALDPLSFSLAHLLDFSLTYHQVVVPALQDGRTVLADRYFYTAWVRDRLRGVPASLLLAAVRLFVRPTVTFYVSASLTEIRARYQLSPAKYGHYGTGSDISSGLLSPEDSFVEYQRRQQEIYADLACIEGFVTVRDSGPVARYLKSRSPATNGIRQNGHGN